MAKDSAQAPFTPMMQQYFEIKDKHKDSILFYRLGDFYEMFFDDAKLASHELELVLTGRDCGQEERAPMCGIPYHSCEGYIARLVEKGYKVAICEQVEDPAVAKGIVKRDVVRVITPGTVIENSMLDEGVNNYLCIIYIGGAEGAKVGKAYDAGLSFTDSSTGEIHLTQIGGEDIISRIINELGRFMPREIIINSEAGKYDALMNYIQERLHLTPQLGDPDSFEYDAAEKKVTAHFKKDVGELYLSDKFSAVRALGGTIHYLEKTQMTGIERLVKLDIYSDIQFMRLDIAARRNLELTSTMRGNEKKGSLLWVLDSTKTAMGKRLIRSWIEQPLINIAGITQRLGAVDELTKTPILRGDLTELLKQIGDLERVMTRIVFGSAGGKDLRMLAQTILALKPIKERLSGVGSTMLNEIKNGLDPLEDVFTLIDNSIVEDPPFSVREGGFIKKGYNSEVDELQFEMSDGKGVIARVEQEQKEKTGIKTLKVGYNRVFGYYIEVSKSYIGQVPDHFIRKQTLTNAERYITQELKELEARILGAKDRVVALEYNLFNEIRLEVASELHRIQSTAQEVARLDVLCSFAEAAHKRGYCYPAVDLGDSISIKNGRHPVVEAILDAPFVPNDARLDGRENMVALITGPNMAGKSTYMRQTALITLMAQIGSFVPAESATIGITDSIFTRVGASDDLASGQSTFMVEMSEVASILDGATGKSLIIFDEIGRGTSTFDGMSIARSVLEYVVKKIKAKTMFATHYHELTTLENEFSEIKNYNIAVKKRGDDITFLRRIVAGPADDSYGIEVAKLAGVPDEVVERAKEVLRMIESGEGDFDVPAIGGGKLPAEERFEDPSGQISFLAVEKNEVVEALRKIDVNTLTPIEALQKLYELSKLADR